MIKDLKQSARFAEGCALGEVVRAEIYRGHRGYYLPNPDECPCVDDLIVNTGRSYLAQRIGANINSPMAHMAIGSGSTAAALTDGSTPGLYGEINRKALSTNSAQTNNVYTAVATWGGAADSVQSIAITEAGVFNHAGSGQGTLFQRVTFASVTLADSDLLKVELTTNVGSNTI